MKNPILENELFIDNVSEALYEIIGEGYESQAMLVCEIKDKYGQTFQAHIVATSNSDGFIDNSEEMPIFGFDEQYRLTEI